MPIFKKKLPIKALFVATEAMPFIKAGGLGEVMFALPQALAEIGCDARVMIPRYAGIDLEKFKLEMELEGLEVPTDAQNKEEPKNLVCNVRKLTPKERLKLPTTFYFLENMEYYEQRTNIYGYTDDTVRWVILCRGVLEFLKKSSWRPDVIICSDWQTGFLPNYLETAYKNDKDLASIATIFAIHNLYYQGTFDHRFVSQQDFDDGHSPIGSFFDPRLLKLNGARRGILYSDLITTVSPTYAKEITAAEFGELLDTLLRERRSRLYGVINGIDYESFNPETNPNIPHHYNIRSLEKRGKNKLALQKRFGLDQNKDAFLVGIVARLIEQKGFDLLLPIADLLLKELKMQLFVLGAGEAKYMGFFQDLDKRYPGQVATNLVFESGLPHFVYAGADAVLIPSKFEPSGLSQMEAMRYGCIPIVRRTGGLADTVEDCNMAEDSGTGFLFEAFDPTALVIVMTRACENFRNTEAWKSLQRRAMARDFSWRQSAKEYQRLFATVISLARKSP